MWLEGDSMYWIMSICIVIKKLPFLKKRETGTKRERGRHKGQREKEVSVVEEEEA